MEILEKRLSLLENLVALVEAKFRNIYVEALNAIKEHNVKKYIFKPSKKELWIVVGREGEYLITEWNKNNDLQFACSCPDYLFHVLLKHSKDIKEKPIIRRPFCYHIVSRIIAEIHEIRKTLGLNYRNDFLPEIIVENDEYYLELIREIMEFFQR